MKERRKKHLYLVPGLAANTKIFDRLIFPKGDIELHFLSWLLPLSTQEPLKSYAKRMASLVTEPDAILIGVSFGGIMVQEMSKHLDVQKIIIISSVKCRKEFPKRLKLIQKTKIYKLFPSNKISTIEDFSILAFGSYAKKRVQLYNEFLSIKDREYLEWAIYNVLHWKQKNPIQNTLHIHGDADHVFPIKHIKESIVIPGGSHVMILTKAKSISKIICENI